MICRLRFGEIPSAFVAPCVACAARGAGCSPTLRGVQRWTLAWVPLTHGVVLCRHRARGHAVGGLPQLTLHARSQRCPSSRMDAALGQGHYAGTRQGGQGGPTCQELECRGGSPGQAGPTALAPESVPRCPEAGEKQGRGRPAGQGQACPHPALYLALRGVGRSAGLGTHSKGGAPRCAGDPGASDDAETVSGPGAAALGVGRRVAPAWPEAVSRVH